MWLGKPTNWTCTRRWLIVLVLLMFLPIIPLFTTPRLFRSDVIAQILTSSTELSVTSSAPDANCVLTATSSAHQGRVVAQKRMAAGRLGNDMFVYASMVGIAARNKMVPVYKCDALANTFKVTGTGEYVIRPPAINIIEEAALRCSVLSLHNLYGGQQVPNFNKFIYYNRLKPGFH